MLTATKPRFRRVPSKRLLVWSLAIAVCFVATVLWHFPWDTDRPLTGEELVSTRAYYAKAYEASTAQTEAERRSEEEYVRVAESAAKLENIDGRIRSFVEKYNLSNARVLDVGSGRGYLQDIVADYTGLDISPSVKRFYRKPLVVGSATAMPFRDSEFDALWSVWVLEHVPNPEAALREIRRVIKPNGLILLMPAWRSREWAAEGYEARPYSDFGIGGKLVKASLIVRSNRLFLWSMLVPTRMIRLTTARLQGGPTRLHYRRLEPNYEVYWQPDSDAVNSLDAVEVMTWFESRGDECLNCSAARLFHRQQPLVIRVRKSA